MPRGWQGSIWLVPIALAATGAAISLGAACGGESTESNPPPETPVSEVEITVEFPSAEVQETISALRYWVLRVDDETVTEVSPTCANLVGGAVDPYDFVFQRLGDGSSMDTSQVLAAEDVELGPALAHVEAVDYLGAATLAGCVAIDVVQPLTEATIVLQKAGVFDCSDPETEDGSPCDDGLACIVGETCQGGSCSGGVQRDCTYLADDCNAEDCDEEVGCIAVPIGNDTPCDDGLYCTEGDVCTNGECLGIERDCLLGAGPCQYLIQCDEMNDECDVGTSPNNTVCDDGVYCNGTERCYYGDCTYSTGDPCDENVGDSDDDCSESCNETTDDCTADDPDNSFCTDGDLCTGAEHCGSGACGSSTGDPCESFLGDNDNDCSESCNGTTGQCTANDPQGSSCNDGNPATTGDQCNGSNVCAGT